MEHTMSATWASANTDSTRSTDRYRLDQNDTKDILVYKYRSGLPNPEITTQHELCKYLDKAPNSSAASISKDSFTSSTKSDSETCVEPRFRVSRKKIPRGDSRVDVRMEDLFSEEERELYSKYPSSKNSLASVGLPSRVYWKRLLFNSYPDLYIVSPVSSPNSSPNNSPESSQHVSPQSTFPKNDQTQEAQS